MSYDPKDPGAAADDLLVRRGTSWESAARLARHAAKALNMKLEELLGSLLVEQWRTKQAVALGWYDGPLEGICSLARPGGEFYFELLDERYNPDGLDDRLYRLSEIAPGSVDAILAAIRDLGTPVNPVWVPVWKFPSKAVQEKAEQQVQRIRESARPTSLVIWTRDMEQFLGCWQVERPETDIADWFSFLGIPQEETAERE